MSSGISVRVKLDGADELQRVMRTAERDVLRDFRSTGKREVSTPLAREVERLAHGNYLIERVGQVKPRSGNFPAIAAGGRRPVASGGLTAGQAAIGGAFGANRDKWVTYERKGRPVRRRTARQMPQRVRGDGNWFYPSFKREAPRVLERWNELWRTVARKWEHV